MLGLPVLMATPQEQHDDAMFDFSQANYDQAIGKLKALLSEQPEHFDARLALGMAYYRRGDYAAAIAEGHKAEQLQPKDQLVHTNLSLFYLKAGDKAKAEHHGLQARLAGWRENMGPPEPGAQAEPELRLAQPRRPTVKAPPPRDMPWKKKLPVAAPASPAPSSQEPAAEPPSSAIDSPPARGQ